jgi:cytosolic 5'-nucleotidase 3
MGQIVINDRKKFEEKIRILKAGGATALHVITDFDRTITKEVIEGQKVSLSYHPLYECFKKEDYKKKLKGLFDYYQPFEFDHKLSIEDKSRLMEEWWDKYFRLVEEYGITEKALYSEAIKIDRSFRPQIREFFKTLEESEVPVLIFSAGVGNLIRFYLKEEKISEKNVHILSNNLEFTDGKMTGYTRPLIHSFNKDERHVKSENYGLQMEGRKNVLLIGDSIGDLTMAEGMKHDCILKIGFLNAKVEERLEYYKKRFDVVILGDGGFEEINSIIKEVIG